MKRFWLVVVMAAMLAAGSLITSPRTGAQTPAWQTVLAVDGAPAPHGVINGVAIDLRGGPSGTKWAYTLDTLNRRVIKFGTGGRLITTWPYGNQAKRGARGRVAVDPSGNVYVADGGTNRVLKFSPNGKLLAQWGHFGGLQDIATDRHGNVYLAQYQARLVVERSPSGAVLHRWSTRTLWHGESVGYPTGVTVAPNGSVSIAATCLSGTSCAPRISYLAGQRSGNWIDLLLPVRQRGPSPDLFPDIGLDRTVHGLPLAPRDTCNHRFVMLQSITTAPRGRMYVAGMLWPRTADAPSPAVGLGPGTPGCTHDGIGPDWTVWPLSSSSAVHGMAVDGSGAIYVAQNNRILKLTP